MEVQLNIPAAEQLIKVVASGVGAIAGPMLARWKSRASADALREEARAKADSIRLITAAQEEARGRLAIDPTLAHSELDIREEIHTRITFQEEKRQRNIEAVVRGAADDLGNKQVHESQIDHDWTAIFFTEAQDVSSEKMQQLWAKILAREVEKPGTTSMRTLSILKTISQRDAGLFQRATRFVLGNFILKDDETKRNVPNFPSYAEFMRLSHNGLFQLGTGLHISFHGRNEYHFLEEDVVCRIFKDGEEAFDLSFPSHILSPSGEEIYEIVKQTKSDEYICALARFLHKRYQAKLAYARILSSDGKPLSKAPFVVVDPSDPNTPSSTR